MRDALDITGASQSEMPLYAITLNRIFGEYGEHMQWDPDAMSWWGRTLWNDPGLGWTAFRDGELIGLGLNYCKRAVIRGRPLKLLIGGPSGVMPIIRGAGHAMEAVGRMEQAGIHRDCDAFTFLADPRYPAYRFYLRRGYRPYLVRQPRGRGLDPAMISTVLIDRAWLQPLLAPLMAVRPPRLPSWFTLRPYQMDDRSAVRALMDRRLASFDYAEVADEELWRRIYEGCPPTLGPLAWVMLDRSALVGYAYGIQRRIVMRRKGRERLMSVLQFTDLFWDDGYEPEFKELMGQVLSQAKSQGAHAAFHLLADHLPHTLQVAHGFTTYGNPPLHMMMKALKPGIDQLFAGIKTYHELLPFP